MIVLFIAGFFFSSRRRHTRLQGDWSSDVCSSDLDLPQRKLGVDVENGFTPEYVTIKEKAKTLAEIKKRSEEHTSELQSPCNLVCRLLLEKKKEPKEAADDAHKSVHPYTEIHAVPV